MVREGLEDVKRSTDIAEINDILESLEDEYYALFGDALCRFVRRDLDVEEVERALKNVGCTAQGLRALQELGQGRRQTGRGPRAREDSAADPSAPLEGLGG